MVRQRRAVLALILAAVLAAMASRHGVPVDGGDLLWPVEHGQRGGGDDVPHVVGQVLLAAERGQQPRGEDCRWGLGRHLLDCGSQGVGGEGGREGG